MRLTGRVREVVKVLKVTEGSGWECVQEKTMYRPVCTFVSARSAKGNPETHGLSGRVGFLFPALSCHCSLHIPNNAIRIGPNPSNFPSVCIYREHTPVTVIFGVSVMGV